MPATTELLVEQIRQIAQQITSAESRGEDTALLKKQHEELHCQWSQANQALTESKQLLKG